MDDKRRAGDLAEPSGPFLPHGQRRVIEHARRTLRPVEHRRDPRPRRRRIESGVLGHAKPLDPEKETGDGIPVRPVKRGERAEMVDDLRDHVRQGLAIPAKRFGGDERQGRNPIGCVTATIWERYPPSDMPDEVRRGSP